VNYTYDGDGDRVQKSNGKIYWYGAGSQVLDESDASGNVTDEYIYFGGDEHPEDDCNGGKQIIPSNYDSDAQQRKQ
jgi:hypothetical protein